MKGNASIRKGATIRICEIYSSRQGEGLLSGTQSVFLRTSGCNLRCWFCDTPFASWKPEGDHQPLDEVLDAVVRHDASHVVITGGEPTIHRSLAELCDMLNSNQRHITIETAGTIFLDLKCDLISISPKLKNSFPAEASIGWQQAHEARRHRPDIVQRWIDNHPYQLKFVIGTPDDASDVLEYLDHLRSVELQRVLMMPQGTSLEELNKIATWLLPWCEAHAVQYCPRLHIEWYGNRRGT